MPLLRKSLIWAAVGVVLATPLIAAALSPLLQWRQPVYIAAGFAGIVGMALLLIQPLLIAGLLPGLNPLQERRIHRWTGTALVLSVILHVAGLWLTSPPDVVDALLFNSPTPFTPWGVIAMWALFATATLAFLRRRLRLRWRTWRIAHTALALVIVIGSVVHAILITGTMETVSKITLCTLAIALTLRVAFDPNTLKRLRRAR
ncbi:ferric reductase [Roseovarius sp. HI0049]|nr:ferric reductase [Roseovarius sp. HI0049]